MDIGHKNSNFKTAKGLKSTLVAIRDSFHTAQFHISCRFRHKKQNVEKKKEIKFLTW